MLKAHIPVRDDTDIAGELDILSRTALAHRLDDASVAAMIDNVRLVLSSVKQSLSDLGGAGISTDIKKVVTSDAYQVTIEAQRTHSTSGKTRNVLARFFGR